MIFPVKHLPQVILIGVQTESGVEPVGFDLRSWLDVWDDISVTVWPTRPGEDAAYPAANTELVGTVLYWYPNEADTAIAGMGKVELLGLTKDKRKLSGWCETNVKHTSLATTQEAPEAARPWVDEVLDAAEEAKRQADRAAEIVENASGGSVTFDPKDAGKLVYISQGGKLIPLELGFGLEIKDGKLEVTDRQIIRAICGTFRSGEATCGEV